VREERSEGAKRRVEGCVLGMVVDICMIVNGMLLSLNSSHQC